MTYFVSNGTLNSTNSTQPSILLAILGTEMQNDEGCQIISGVKLPNLKVETVIYTEGIKGCAVV